MVIKGILYSLILVFSTLNLAQEVEEENQDPNIDKVRGMVSYYRFILNTIGGASASASEKETIISDSYEKVFDGATVQIEDDLVQDRSALINKNVQAYLRDVDFFFRSLKFNFSDIEVTANTSEAGNEFYTASFVSEMQGVDLEGDSINSVMDRYMEVNLTESGLKIVSVYTTKVDRKTLFQSWWDDLPPIWVNYFTKLLNVRTVPMPIDQILKLEDIDSINLSMEFWVKDISPLSMLRNLRYVNLNSTLVEDLSPLRYAQNLKHLDMSYTLVPDLKILNYFKGLNYLDISGNSYFYLGDLTGIPIRTLYANNVNVPNFGILSELRQLQKLSLASNILPGTRMLSGLPIVELDLSNTNVSDLSGISGNESIRLLNLDQSAVTELNALSGLKGLKTLSIKGTKIKSLDPLNGLPNLERIDADFSEINDEHASRFMGNNPNVLVTANTKKVLGWWSGLPIDWQEALMERLGLPQNPGAERLIRVLQVDSLNLSHLELISGTPISAFRRLKYLNINDTKIVNLDFLLGNPELEILTANNSPIAGLKGVGDCHNLKRIEVEKTFVKTIKDVRGLKQLNYLNLEQTEVPEKEILSMLENKNLTIVYQRSQLKSWWETLPPNWASFLKGEIGADPTTEMLHKLVARDTISIVNKSIQSLLPLSKFRRLQTVILDNTQVLSLLELSNHPTIRNIHYRNGPLYTLEGVESMKNLKALTISNTPVDDLEAVSRLKNLEYLDCSGTQIKSIKDLRDVRSLKYLDISNTRAWRLHWLFEIDNMEELICYNSRVNDRKIRDFKEVFPDCLVTYY